MTSRTFRTVKASNVAGTSKYEPYGCVQAGEFLGLRNAWNDIILQSLYMRSQFGNKTLFQEKKKH